MCVRTQLLWECRIETEGSRSTTWNLRSLRFAPISQRPVACPICRHWRGHHYNVISCNQRLTDSAKGCGFQLVIDKRCIRMVFIRERERSTYFSLPWLPETMYITICFITFCREGWHSREFLGEGWQVRMGAFKFSVDVSRAKSKALTLHMGFEGRSQCL